MSSNTTGEQSAKDQMLVLTLLIHYRILCSIKRYCTCNPYSTCSCAGTMALMCLAMRAPLEAGVEVVAEGVVPGEAEVVSAQHRAMMYNKMERLSMATRMREKAAAACRYCSMSLWLLSVPAALNCVVRALLS